MGVLGYRIARGPRGSQVGARDGACCRVHGLPRCWWNTSMTSLVETCRGCFFLVVLERKCELRDAGERRRKKNTPTQEVASVNVEERRGSMKVEEFMDKGRHRTMSLSSRQTRNGVAMIGGSVPFGGGCFGCGSPRSRTDGREKKSMRRSGARANRQPPNGNIIRYLPRQPDPGIFQPQAPYLPGTCRKRNLRALQRKLLDYPPEAG